MDDHLKDFNARLNLLFSDIPEDYPDGIKLHPDQMRNIMALIRAQKADNELLRTEIQAVANDLRTLEDIETWNTNTRLATRLRDLELAVTELNEELLIKGGRHGVEVAERVKKNLPRV